MATEPRPSGPTASIRNPGGPLCDNGLAPDGPREKPLNVPENPRLRPLDPQWVEQQGRRYLYLRDPLGLSERTVLVPQELTPLLALLDGTRDEAGIQASLALRNGLQLSLSQVREFVAGMDTALMLESGTYRTAAAQALSEYREAGSRRPSRAGLVYPAGPSELAKIIEDYTSRAPADDPPLPASATLRGVVSPHIDYERGGETYARLWRMCAPALEEVELVIVLGTDHAGSSGSLTLTRQSYATPLGVLPTDREVVDGLAKVIGTERAFAEELHHVNEHSIELAAVWLHHYMGGRACPMVPVLCGSFKEFVESEREPDGDQVIGAALHYLKGMTAGRRTLVVAAGDLAHVGPAFGDATAVDGVGKAMLAAQDAESIAAIRRGDAAGFLGLSRAEQDRRNICGLSPIYMALKLIGEAAGESVGYAQCPADATGGSLVSIVGAVLWEE